MLQLGNKLIPQSNLKGELMDLPYADHKALFPGLQQRPHPVELKVISIKSPSKMVARRRAARRRLTHITGVKIARGIRANHTVGVDIRLEIG